MDTLLPRAVIKALEAVAKDRRYPGLMLDKLQSPPKMEAQKDGLETVAKAKGDPALLEDLLKRRKAMLDALGATVFTATTAGPLTLHLARSGPFENAGLCLHPVHGFAWLPGSGLKGLARAYAETHWLPDQPDKAEAWRRIGAVFGRIKETDQNKDWRPEGAFDDTGVGRVVFHDAWPTAWPDLIIDIANNHHPDYYQKDKDAPGDWENPNPVYFLAVNRGTTFSFALSPLRETDIGLVALATEWLKGAIVHAGAGAKTATGYGGFTLSDGASPVPPGTLKHYEVDLELVTPAFLAGAMQEEKDCDLRPATLRGQLRWWWRTMHAGHLDVPTLKALEAAVWGDTERGSPVRLAVVPLKHLRPQPFDPKKIADRCGLPKFSHQRTVMGLDYGSYGMAKSKNKPARQYLPEATKWRLTLSARAARFRHTGLSADAVLAQAQAALWLLCRYGGVGSKSRNGYGCFADITVPDISELAECQKIAANLRRHLGLQAGGRTAAPETPSLKAALWAEVPLRAASAFAATHEVGRLMQEFRKEGGLKSGQRAVLGLPGKGRGKGPKGDRHAAPIHLHVTRDGNGFRLRVTAFPVSTLLFDDPDATTATKLLKQAVNFYRERMAPSTTPHRHSGARPVRRTLADRRGTHNGESCTVLREDGDRLLVKFDNEDSEWISKSSFEPE